MRSILLAAFLLCTPALAAAPPAAPPATRPGAPVVLALHPGTPLDAAARQLAAQDLQGSARSGPRPLVLTGTAALGTATDRLALFVQLQSARDCGSAGCSTTVHIWQNGAYKRVLDGVDGPLVVGPGRSRGMADLTTEHDRYVWNGQQYANVHPAPAVDLRPRRRP